MDKLVIEGGKTLSGTIRIQGAKNAALPILAASMMTDELVRLENIPQLLDIKVMQHILRSLGCRIIHNGSTVSIDASGAHSTHVPENLMRQMRSSIFLMGPMLARFKKVHISQPGGCAIGERKIDLHLRSLQALGATLDQYGNQIICQADRLIGTDIHLDFPSVGATENVMMAAVLAEGTSVITNAAREPEIYDLQQFLNHLGANITGAGTDTIVVTGVDKLTGGQYEIMPDRIVAGTLMIAAAATRGAVTLTNANPIHLTSLIHILRRAGVQIATSNGIINVTSFGRVKAVDCIVTSPYPAFPTDLQAQLMVLLSLADGVSMVKETVFEGRFKHVAELSRMGANIRVDLNNAFVRGVLKLYGTTVEATDLRAGAALVIAGLAASGRTIVENVQHIDRGYDQIEHMLNRLGAKIDRLISIPKLDFANG